MGFSSHYIIVTELVRILHRIRSENIEEKLKEFWLLGFHKNPETFQNLFFCGHFNLESREF